MKLSRIIRQHLWKKLQLFTSFIFRIHKNVKLVYYCEKFNIIIINGSIVKKKKQPHSNDSLKDHKSEQVA